MMLAITNKLNIMSNENKLNTMSDENKSIHNFDINLICEYFSTMERQGPGSPEETIKALSFIHNLHEQSKIADIGCGTGGQTMVLAQNAPGFITGIDMFPAFIDIFNSNSKKIGLQNRVQGITGTMEALPFSDEELDLIWAEGSIYNIGYEKGLKEWRRFLKPGGFIAVSEASWFTEYRPAEIESFWMDAYSQIDTIPNKIFQLQKAGYVPCASFILPNECWLDFYEQQVKAQKAFLEKYPDNSMALDLVKNERHEAELFHEYKEFYGYVFYIGRKI